MLDWVRRDLDSSQFLVQMQWDSAEESGIDLLVAVHQYMINDFTQSCCSAVDIMAAKFYGIPQLLYLQYVSKISHLLDTTY